ncbi:zinc finger CCCH domain-containing protein 3 isoform X2 [Ascaphus truei]|uniref:zinc finger CCCH domain-containing protein 3 isoform X2 n=1 Tax=Ascaphus truei TaxID=8439 RepID=UPI003F59C684
MMTHIVWGAAAAVVAGGEMEEEKESLRRQIRSLQDLINSHKTLHGNAPAAPGWRNPSQPEFRTRGAFRDGPSQRGYPFSGPQPPSRGNTWRKKYSLVNRTPGNATEPTNAAPAATSNGNPKNCAAAPTLPPHSSTAGVMRTSQLGVNITLGKQKASDKPSLVGKDGYNIVSVAKPSVQHITAARNSTKQAHLKDSAGTVAPPSSAQRMTRPTPAVHRTHSEHVGLASKKRSPASVDQEMLWTSPEKKTPTQKAPVLCSVQAKVPGRSAKTESLTISANSTPSNPSTDTSKRRLVSPHTIFSSPKSTSTPLLASTKVPKGGKTKYTWVANPAKTNLTGKKSVSPSAKKLPTTVVESFKSPTVLAKGKKNGIHPKAVTTKNRYKWKAERPGQVSPDSVLISSCQPASHKPEANVYHSPATFREMAQSSYKVKSRTKIIRRRSNSSSPTEKRASPLAPLTMKSHYSLRRRSSPRLKSPPAFKKISPRGLVHITKHRLRRLPPPKEQCPAREGLCSPPFRSPLSSRVIKTRYKIVKRSALSPPAVSPFSTFSPSLTWRTRLLLLNRVRQLSQSGRCQQHQQRWKSRGLRCIGGVMYRVSANKLSKTCSPTAGAKQTPTTGRLDFSSPCPGSPWPSRSPTPSRYIASRAVQRSLAIIRQAKQKKEKKKEYCMYYNRFGKCNRGQNCPYIHDADKVAVCTRFLRGTCKQTDGTCPFSHKVSKDKMPVCSYFLKGICHNNDCPYSHVYVSRKAEICQDFLKGYCPMGEKCKKKHTLLCPDYARDGSCLKGSKCKLQHRQRKRPPQNTAHSELARPAGKQRRPAEETSGMSTDMTLGTYASDGPSTSDEELPGTSGLQKLPSFISLNCSLTPPSDVGHRAEKEKTAEDTDVCGEDKNNLANI